jgi:hypothetical protein
MRPQDTCVQSPRTTPHDACAGRVLRPRPSPLGAGAPDREGYRACPGLTASRQEIARRRRNFAVAPLGGTIRADQ